MVGWGPPDGGRTVLFPALHAACVLHTRRLPVTMFKTTTSSDEAPQGCQYGYRLHIMQSAIERTMAQYFLDSG